VAEARGAGGAVDDVIIGAGIVGVAAAAELAAAGASVTVIDRSSVAAGASGRNSGVIWRPPDPVLDALYVESYAMLRELAAERLDRGFWFADQPVGILNLGPDDASLRRRAAQLARTHPQYAAVFLDAPAVHRLEPSVADGLAAVRLDIGFPVTPAAATRAFAARARSLGATIIEGTPARLVADAAGVRGVATDAGTIDAGAVIVAAGPWTPEVVDPSGGWRPIRPFWGVVVELELEAPPRHVLEGAGIDAAIDPSSQDEDASDGAVDFSFVTADGRSSLGSTFLPFEPDAPSYVDRLRTIGASYLPAIADSPTLGFRACARPLAFDGRPLVGAVPGLGRLFVAAGHGPWGLTTGAASARHIAGLVLGRPDAVPAEIGPAVDPSRYPMPGRGGAILAP
jgi:D-hydroxyproline dehydrogenase subunit beta